MRRGGQSYFHLQDMLANVTSLTDSAGAVVEDYEYSAFGKQATPDSALGNPFTFAGRQWDTESSTYYNRARQLDPASGRFTSEDPIRSANAYIYAGNDPVSSRDPSGLFSISELSAANVIRNELMQEQMDFGNNLLGAINGKGPSAKDVAIGVGAVATGLAAFKVVRTIRSVRAASRLNVDVDELLSRAAVPPLGKGTTKAADSLNQHHRDHPAFPEPGGDDAAKNALAHDVLTDIIESSGRRPQSVTTGNFRGGYRFRAPDGRTATFDADGNFQYFGVK